MGLSQQDSLNTPLSFWSLWPNQMHQHLFLIMCVFRTDPFIGPSNPPTMIHSVEEFRGVVHCFEGFNYPNCESKEATLKEITCPSCGSKGVTSKETIWQDRRGLLRRKLHAQLVDRRASLWRKLYGQFVDRRWGYFKGNRMPSLGGEAGYFKGNNIPSLWIEGGHFEGNYMARSKGVTSKEAIWPDWSLWLKGDCIAQSKLC